MLLSGLFSVNPKSNYLVNKRSLNPACSSCIYIPTSLFIFNNMVLHSTLQGDDNRVIPLYLLYK